ncbi:hypothetical protein KC342_g43 [Hortaea werneckii]|nr:hypothetical protein KC342_g43 [Hortaea werneckii]
MPCLSIGTTWIFFAPMAYTAVSAVRGIIYITKSPDMPVSPAISKDAVLLGKGRASLSLDESLIVNNEVVFNRFATVRQDLE